MTPDKRAGRGTANCAPECLICCSSAGLEDESAGPAADAVRSFGIIFLTSMAGRSGGERERGSEAGGVAGGAQPQPAAGGGRRRGVPGVGVPGRARSGAGQVRDGAGGAAGGGAGAREGGRVRLLASL